jgi:3'(2'), 5'-bisphosphate nucleotidase
MPLAVSSCSDPHQARILRSFESGHTNVDQIGDFARLLGVEAAPIKMDSQAKYAVLAAGQGELYLRLLSPDQPDYREKIWDQAAGSLILEEAGGQFSDLHGKPLDFTAGRSLLHNRGILATNRHLHAGAVEALRRSRA